MKMPISYVKQPVKATVTTPTRVIGTEYQNTTGRPLLVFVTILASAGGTDGGQGYITGYSDSSSPPTTAMGAVGIMYGHASDGARFCLAFAVPNEYYYKTTETKSGTGSTTLVSWIEVEL